MREELTWAMERRKRLARGFHPGPLFPGGFELYTRSFWPEHCHMTAQAGSLPRALPAWVGGDLAPASAIGTAAAHCLSTSAPLWRFLAEELHGTHAVSLHRAPSISPEGPWRGSGGSLQAIGYNFLLIIRAKGRRRGEQGFFNSRRLRSLSPLPPDSQSPW